MFNEFEGNADERQTKLDERLTILKRAREAGFFDEEGTEEVEIYAAGINPCDLGIGAFTGAPPIPKMGEPGYRKHQTYHPPFITGDNADVAVGPCQRCKGMGDLWKGGEFECCTLCDGTGRCHACDAQSYGLRDKTCPICNTRGLEPTQ